MILKSSWENQNGQNFVVTGLMCRTRPFPLVCFESPTNCGYMANTGILKGACNNDICFFKSRWPPAKVRYGNIAKTYLGTFPIRSDGYISIELSKMLLSLIQPQNRVWQIQLPRNIWTILLKCTRQPQCLLNSITVHTAAVTFLGRACYPLNFMFHLRSLFQNFTA